MKIEQFCTRPQPYEKKLKTTSTWRVQTSAKTDPYDLTSTGV